MHKSDTFEREETARQRRHMARRRREKTRPRLVKGPMEKLNWRPSGPPDDPYTGVMAETATGDYFIIPTRTGIGYLPMFVPVDYPSCFRCPTSAPLRQI